MSIPRRCTATSITGAAYGDLMDEAYIFLMDEQGTVLAVRREAAAPREMLLKALRSALGGAVVCAEAWRRGVFVVRAGRTPRPRSEWA